MFGARGSNAPTTWKHIENDFVMGACAHQLFGYITRSPSDEWTAFDSDSLALSRLAGPGLSL